MMQGFIYDKVAIGNRIREFRDRLGITQEALAERADRSWRLIADLERGAVGLSLETLSRLCAALQVTPNDLLLPGGEAGEDDLNWLINALENSSDRIRAGAIDILRAYLRSVQP